MFVVVYNPLGSNKSSIVQLPVSVNRAFDITRLGSDDPLTTVSGVYPVPSTFQGSLASTSSSKYILLFDSGPLQPIGATVFQIKPTADSEHGSLSEEFGTGPTLESEHDMDELDAVVASNEILSVKFDR